MLVLSRKQGEQIVIGEGPARMIVTVFRIGKQRVQVGIKGPAHVRRAELAPLTETQEGGKDATREA